MELALDIMIRSLRNVLDSLIVKLLIDNMDQPLAFAFFSLNAMFVYVPYTQLHKNIVR